MFLKTFVSFQKKFRIFVFFQFHTNVNMCFHLNMSRLFQEINMFFFFEIKLVSDKFFSQFKDLIPTCLVELMFIHTNCFQNFSELKLGVAD
jgi:hypothetical protein